VNEFVLLRFNGGINSLISGFCGMVNADFMVCALPKLDTLSRFFALRKLWVADVSCYDWLF
jgi:hypothetical protein